MVFNYVVKNDVSYRPFVYRCYNYLLLYTAHDSPWAEALNQSTVDLKYKLALRSGLKKNSIYLVLNG